MEEKKLQEINDNINKLTGDNELTDPEMDEITGGLMDKTANHFCTELYQKVGFPKREAEIRCAKKTSFTGYKAMHKEALDEYAEYTQS